MPTISLADLETQGEQKKSMRALTDYLRKPV